MTGTIVRSLVAAVLAFLYGCVVGLVGYDSFFVGAAIVGAVASGIVLGAVTGAHAARMSPEAAVVVACAVATAGEFAKYVGCGLHPPIPRSSKTSWNKSGKITEKLLQTPP
jgi:hypothetical protein